MTAVEGEEGQADARKLRAEAAEGNGQQTPAALPPPRQTQVSRHR